MAGSGGNLVPLARMVAHRNCNSTQPRSWKPGDQAPGASGLARTAGQWGLGKRSAGTAR